MVPQLLQTYLSLLSPSGIFKLISEEPQTGQYFNFDLGIYLKEAKYN